MSSELQSSVKILNRLNIESNRKKFREILEHVKSSVWNDRLIERGDSMSLDVDLVARRFLFRPNEVRKAAVQICSLAEVPYNVSRARN